MTTISTFFPDPTGITFQEWGGIVAEQLALSGIPAPYNEESWKTWVSALFYVPELVAKNIPTANGFDTWQAWAEQFIGAVR